MTIKYCKGCKKPILHGLEELFCGTAPKMEDCTPESSVAGMCKRCYEE